MNESINELINSIILMSAQCFEKRLHFIDKIGIHGNKSKNERRGCPLSRNLAQPIRMKFPFLHVTWIPLTI